ncbi:unnamed protein product [Haemonchus placei]|uniref:C-type lectin domain-containing protein n=1 Tax=Haemonchus placei TaxID=6290 RepID=A0A0N4WMS3_HAEPC|nr:unnamed protein product [Haemonchus placei]
MRFQYPFFIGMSDLGGNWTWTDNTPVTYTNWAKGQPSGINQCVISALDNGIWSANSCFERIPYVCAISANSTPPTPCPPPPVCPPQSACTQCPSQPPSCPAPSVVDRCLSEWTCFTDTNSCYKTFLAASFDDTELTCVATGSHLASIHSSSENRFVAGEWNVFP